MTDLSGLRVLAFCDYFSPDSIGGSERVASEVYRRLANDDAHVLLLTTAVSGGRRRFEADGIDVRVVPALDLRRVTRAQVSLAPAVIREARLLLDAWHPTVLHANSIHFQTSVAAALLHRRTGVPMVTTMHLAQPKDLPLALRAATAAYEQSVGRFILRSSAEVIAVSEGVGRHARRLGVPATRVHVVPNGVDRERFRPDETLERKGGRPLVLFIGRLISNKGPQVLMDAIGRVPDLDFDVVFLGDGPMRRELQREAAERGIEELVRFEGVSEDVAGWLRRADVLVRPSFTEGLPLTVLEAMASRVCVVASNVEGNRDLVRNGQSGLLFPVGDAGALAAALARVLSHPEERSRLAEEGSRSSRAYSWDAAAEATGEILAGVSRGAKAAS